MHQRKGIFTVKFAYKVAREVLREGRVAESTQGCAERRFGLQFGSLEFLKK